MEKRKTMRRLKQKVSTSFAIENDGETILIGEKGIKKVNNRKSEKDDGSNNYCTICIHSLYPIFPLSSIYYP